MVLDIWKECEGKNNIVSLSEIVWRIVESQEYASTRKLVNSLSQQILLEQMIESTKPLVPADCSGLHQLLYTSFRYPPLLNGSRFGRRHERALWYGSQILKTAMAEIAYYRFNFLRASEANFGVVVTQLTAFSAQIKTDQAARLFDAPFSRYADIVSSPVDYSVSQKLGTSMRDDGVDAFNYQSARDPESGMNVGLFAPSAFGKKQPERDSFQSWQCVTDHRAVEFVRTSALETNSHHFSIDMFLVDGQFPFPAL